MRIVEIKAESGPELPAGALIDGRYEILGALGRGGFAMVYRARHVHMGREVALKLLNEGLPESHAASIRQRFEREAQVLAQLSHPHVVTAHDSGFHGEHRRPFIVMASLSGLGLDKVLAEEGPMAPSRAMRLLTPCLEALAEAHERGIVHKDLKPSNFFLTRPGTPTEALMILDFGAVTLFELPEARLTHNGEMIGTPQYLAPEYIKDRVVSPALDVYQIGLLLVEMLTGELAVGTRNPYLCLMSHCRGDLRIPWALRQSPLGPIVERALSVDHLSRYPNARALLEALERPLKGEDLRDIVRRTRSLGISPDLRAPREETSTALLRGEAPVQTTTVISRGARQPFQGAWALLYVACVALVCAGSLAVAVGAALASESDVLEVVSAPAPSELVFSRVSGSERLRRVESSRVGALPIEAVSGSRHMRRRGPERLFDGDPSTSWRPRGSGSRWIEVDLGRRARIRGLVVAVGFDGALDGAPKVIGVRADRGELLALELEARPGLQRVMLPASIEARTLRLTFPEGVESLGELQIWGR